MMHKNTFQLMILLTTLILTSCGSNNKSNALSEFEREEFAQSFASIPEQTLDQYSISTPGNYNFTDMVSTQGECANAFINLTGSAEVIEIDTDLYQSQINIQLNDHSCTFFKNDRLLILEMKDINLTGDYTQGIISPDPLARNIYDFNVMGVFEVKEMSFSTNEIKPIDNCAFELNYTKKVNPDNSSVTGKVCGHNINI